MFSKIFDKKQTGGESAFGAFREKYVLTDEVLGKGSYAEVRKARNKKTSEVVAVKIIDKTGLSRKELKGLSKEVEILRRLKHKNVVRFHDSFEEPHQMLVVMEFVGGGELFQKIVSEDGGYDENDARRVIRTLAEALKHCKDRGVIHRDIKPQNLLLTPDSEGGELKLADFNLSIQIEPESVQFSILETMCGTPNYVAPEILSQKPYDYKCDIWSLGVIAYLLLSGGYLPFFVDEDGELGKEKLLQKVRRGRWHFYPDEAWKTVSEPAKKFMVQVMERNPEKRYTYEQLLADPWMKSEETIEGPKIDVQEFQMSNTKRLMLSASAVKQAVGAFERLMKEEEKTPQRVGEVDLGFQGQSGFDVMLDDM